MPREPHRGLDIAWNIDETALASLANHNSRLVCMRYRRIGELRRIGHVARYHSEQRILDGRKWHTKLRTRNPVRVFKSGNNWMLPLDARKIRIRIAPSANDRAHSVNPEDVRQPKICPAFLHLVVHTGLERRQQRSALLHVIAQLPALLIAQQRNIRENKR